MKHTEDIQSWANLVAKLGPLEQLALIGLIDKIQVSRHPPLGLRKSLERKSVLGPVAGLMGASVTSYTATAGFALR